MTTSDPYAAPVTEQPSTTSEQPDPTEVGDATVDAAKPVPDATIDFSDAANAALYPDIEHPDTPELPPDAMQVPPPLAQREGTLLDIIRAYASGQTDWDATKQALIDFDYQPRQPRVGAPSGPSAGQWYDDVAADVGTSADDDTWDQLQEAADAGMLSREEFNEVLAARAQRGQEAEQEAQQKAESDTGGQPAR